jgi:hypothetical protein
MNKVNAKEQKEEKVMAAIIANPNSDNKKLVEKTKLGRETIRLTVKDLVAKGKVIAVSSGKTMTFVAKEKKTATKAFVKSAAKTEKVTKSSADNDRSKIVFNGQELSKGKFVLEVIREEVKKNPNITLPELVAKYPNNTHRKYGVVQLKKEAEKKCLKQKRFFVREDQIITLKDGTQIAVCSDWGAGNIPNFERRAKQNGHNFSYSKK